MPTSLVSTGVSFPDGTIQTTKANTSQVRYELFTSGNTAWTCPTGITSVEITCIGGGGGGCSGQVWSVDNGETTVYYWSNGNSGGAGGLARGIYTVTPGTVYSANVGAGGDGSNTGSGSAGKLSSFGIPGQAAIVTATGGGGAVFVTSPQNSSTDGTAGAGTGGIFSNGSIASGTAPFSGIGIRINATSSTGNVAWSNTAGYSPGSRGAGETGSTSGGGSDNSNNDATGGVGGAILILYNS